MSAIPIAGPRTEGRIFGKDWSVTLIAKLLRANADRGAWDTSAATASSAESVNRYYLRKVSAAHMPTRASVIFMRLAKENCLYASLCFVAGDTVLPWNPVAAEQWLTALFGENRAKIRTDAQETDSIRQFRL